MRELVTTQTLHDEVAEILMADTILDTSALAPLGDEGQGDCALHDGCRPIT
ncbi:hypothetical protein [Pseudolysinimonas sp.]